MKLYDYMVERFCIQEEDQKEMKTDLERWRKESEEHMYKKDPPYLLEVNRTNDEQIQNDGGKSWVRQKFRLVLLMIVS